MNKLNNPTYSVFHSNNYCINSVVLPFFLLSFLKCEKCFLVLDSVSFKPVNKIEFSSFKQAIPIKYQSATEIYIILCSFCNFGNSGRTREGLKYRWMIVMNDRNNPMAIVNWIIKSFLAHPLFLVAGLIIILSVLLNPVFMSIFSSVSSSHLYLHEVIYISKDFKDMLSELYTLPYISDAWKFLV